MGRRNRAMSGDRKGDRQEYRSNVEVLSELTGRREPQFNPVRVDPLGENLTVGGLSPVVGDSAPHPGGNAESCTHDT